MGQRMGLGQQQLPRTLIYFHFNQSVWQRGNNDDEAAPTADARCSTLHAPRSTLLDSREKRQSGKVESAVKDGLVEGPPASENRVRCLMMEEAEQIWLGMPKRILKRKITKTERGGKPKA